MNYDTIRVERDGLLSIITLHRPESLNAISKTMVAELTQTLEAAEHDPDIHVVLITGAPRPDGRPCFSAGADIKERGERTASPAGEPFRHTMDSAYEVAMGLGPKNESIYNRCFNYLESMRTPSIAVIDGICTTGGLELALCCDLRVVSDRAQLSDWHTKNLGVIGGAGVTTRLPHLVGTARAKEILWTGDPLSGQEAYRVGLANRSVPHESLMAEAKALANKIAAMSPTTIAASKAVISASIEQGVHEGIRYGYLWSAMIALDREINGTPTPPSPLR